jgi:hypothetical protein
MANDNENEMKKKCEYLKAELEKEFKKEDPLWDGIHEPEDFDKQNIKRGW